MAQPPRHWNFPKDRLMQSTLGCHEGAFVLMGARASGKSTLGRRLAHELAWPYLSFGAYVRRQAIARGLGSQGLQQGLGKVLGFVV
jgi:hypothetical protein